MSAEQMPAASAKAAPHQSQGNLEASENQHYASGFRLFLILSSLLLCVFCQALDDAIIATAVPRITDEFQRLDDIGWYGSAYLLTNSSLQLLYSKLYSLPPLRWVFLASLSLFELGSLISPTSAALIAGRAVTGIGSAGITSGALNIMAHVTPVHRRPLFLSFIGGIYGIASVSGPIVGGVFAQNVTWRWNFYLNKLPPPLDPGLERAHVHRRRAATLLRVGSPPAHWAGYQILFATGSGLGFQQPFVTAHTVLPLPDIARGVALMNFARLGGGAVFVAVAQNVFAQSLVRNVQALGLDGVDAGVLVHLGATQLGLVVPAEEVPRVLGAYNAALGKTYQVGLVIACVSIVGSAGMRWVPLAEKESGEENDESRENA